MSVVMKVARLSCSTVLDVTAIMNHMCKDDDNNDGIWSTAGRPHGESKYY